MATDQMQVGPGKNITGWVMEEVPSQTITKLEGAERQLRAAIRLFFEDWDLLPVQTLAAAAHEVLFQLSGRKEGGSLLKNSGLIKPEMQKEWIDRIKSVPNFLKHASKDATKTEQFYPETIEYWIFDCILMHEKMGYMRLRESVVFLGWFISQNPHIFTPGAFGADAGKVSERGGVSKAIMFEVIKDPKTYPVPGK